jgi:hypothetical protein
MGERHGFDGTDELRLHAGTDAHRDENQTETANSVDSAKKGNVLAFRARPEAALQMAA